MFKIKEILRYLIEMTLQGENPFKIVRIPLFDLSVFSGREEHVRVGDELDGCHGVIVRKDGLVTITKIETPNFNVFVGRPGR